MNKPLENKSVIITGASRGIGRAIALKFAELGANIAINFVRNEDAAVQVAKEVQAIGQKAFILQGNIADTTTMDEIVQKTVDEFGGIDIIVHNAALGAFKPVHKLKQNQWDLSMDVNTKALFLLTQKALPYLEKSSNGVILALSSLGGQKFIPNYGAIGISKAALENLIRYLGAELAGKGIRVNCVSGGLVDTDALKSFPDYESFKEEALRRTPAGRIGTPEDLANVAAFLASDSSKWICGQTIIADGGLSLIC